MPTTLPWGVGRGVQGEEVRFGACLLGASTPPWGASTLPRGAVRCGLLFANASTRFETLNEGGPHMRRDHVRFLLIGGLLLAVAGCASGEEWRTWKEHPT